MKTVIIGSGPAGYTAAIYASRSGMEPVLYEGNQPGGQLTQTTEIDNFPGYPEGTTGNELMEDLRAQAERLGTEIRMGSITAVDFSMDGSRPHVLTIDDGTTVEADTVIISTGASAKYLGLDDEKKYQGMGVSACATCDGFFYRKKVVAVVGGGDTACEEAQYLAGLCKKVYLIVRRDVLRASEAMQKKVKEIENIEILWNTQVRGLYGADGVDFTEDAKVQLADFYRLGYDKMPICMAKTPNSLTDNAKIMGRPTGFRITVKELRVSTGAGFVVVLTGAIMTMPGLPKVPQALKMDYVDGKAIGLFQE